MQRQFTLLGSHACSAPPREKSAKEIQGEIQALVRQITASVTFLPLLDEAASFDLLAYTDSVCDALE